MPRMWFSRFWQRWESFTSLRRDVPGLTLYSVFRIPACRIAGMTRTVAVSILLDERLVRMKTAGIEADLRMTPVEARHVAGLLMDAAALLESGIAGEIRRDQLRRWTANGKPNARKPAPEAKKK